ncbi:SET domain-containing protein [Actomonas aquatica]|uniref:SET domain-containing protein-lysine N-methyltransferase n=1 Tax=Actomonas aquatica TaxID=2866162 RepID=A0ABZ1CEH8_9BACT|nr:SET domain-containing protein-lysine N-methyltransferase [Opitutus sp. WL0086]WRQ90074.1 SET domain-containing protein-lysine N-methyltransferase [Opitutus sp. WL0086]
MVTVPDDLIEARGSVIHGRGVYARGFIAEGEVVMEYTGERIPLGEAVRREQLRQAREAAGETGDVVCDYLYILDDAWAIDGRGDGNVARLINHHCEPNCASDIWDDRVWIVASRDIEAGEELSFDYGYTFRDGLGHPCRCGAPSCVGYIVARHQRWRVRRWLRERDAAAVR